MNELVSKGNNFDNLEGFYCEIDRLLTKNLSFKTGHNYESFNDLLKGGFGVFDIGEPILIKWINYAKSKNDLENEVILTLLEIILDFNNSGHKCRIELY